MAKLNQIIAIEKGVKSRAQREVAEVLRLFDVVATKDWANREAGADVAVHVLYEAPEKHPAQVETFTEDVVVGTWTKVAFSGALPARRLNELRDRVDRLLSAVKYAREEANTAEVGDAVFAYLFS